ncbi:MAG: diguanylate cyclase [Thermodesulfobacteriota bacterium]|nr:diguanylate cyclase [Thermodesulfobacteriota bacterium]
MLFLKKKSSVDLKEKELSQRLQDVEGKQEVFLLAIRALLLFIKDFSLDLEEIDAKGFKEDIDFLSQKISTQIKKSKLQSLFEKYKRIIRSYIEQEKEYLGEREAELKNIIDLLSKAIAVLNSENRDFNEKIYEQSEKMEQITLLDDIKKIRTALGQEIELMRKTVRDKQARDADQVQFLSKRVKSLQGELERAESESLRDGLTGVYNRRGLDRHLREIVEQNTVAKSPFSMLILDIDDFKNINDTYGHQTGDRVILAMVQKCREYVRKDDFLARYGGEEFVILLPGVSLRNAKKKAKSICKGIAATRYAINTGEEDIALSFTVSIGVSAHRKGDTVSTVTDRTDKALYAAKQSGKNRVVSEKDLN